MVVAGAFVFGRCGGEKQGRADMDLEWKERNAALVAQAYKASRDSIPALTARKRTADRTLATVRTNSVATLTSTDAETAISRAVATDSGNSAEIYRARLMVQVATTDSLAVAFRSYLAADSVKHAADDALLVHLNRTLILADSTIAAKDAVIRALQKRECRVLGLPCPSRRTAFVGGLMVAGVLVTRIR